MGDARERSRHDGKVFIGGLSWETTDEKLKRYFENYGTVQEAFVSYDRNTGRPRGFGFVVFADPVIADKVVLQQHTIDRREVEAKKALPKEESPVSKDQQAVATGQRTKKIFVGGLAPTVDEDALRGYFGDFGGVDDAVVMYDHENRRPRGFGFVTFGEEEAVDKVFARGSIQVIHERQVEIKRAVPRDAMPPSPRAVYRGPPPPYHDGGHSPYSERQYGGRGSFRGGYAGGGYATPYGGRGSGMRSPMGGSGAMYSPPAVVTGIPANMATPPATEAGIPAGGALAVSSMTTPMAGMQSPINMASQAMQSPSQQLVGGYAALQNGMQAAAVAAANAAQLPASAPAVAYSMDAQQQAAMNLADVQQQLALSSVSDALEHLQQQQAQQQAAQQQQQQQAQAQQAAQQAQQQAQATIWS